MNSKPYGPRDKDGNPRDAVTPEVDGPQDAVKSDKSNPWESSPTPQVQDTVTPQGPTRGQRVKSALSAITNRRIDPTRRRVMFGAAAAGVAASVALAGNSSKILDWLEAQADRKVILGSNWSRVHEFYREFHGQVDDPEQIILSARSLHESLPPSELEQTDSNFWEPSWETRFFLASVQPNDVDVDYPLSIVTTFQALLNSDVDCDTSGWHWRAGFYLNAELELGLVSFGLGYVPIQSSSHPLDDRLAGDLSDDSGRGSWWAENRDGRLHLWISHENSDLGFEELFSRVRKTLLSPSDIKRDACNLKEVIEDQIGARIVTDADGNAKVTNKSPMGDGLHLGLTQPLGDVKPTQR